MVNCRPWVEDRHLDAAFAGLDIFIGKLRCKGRERGRIHQFVAAEAIALGQEVGVMHFIRSRRVSKTNVVPQEHVLFVHLGKCQALTPGVAVTSWQGKYQGLPATSFCKIMFRNTEIMQGTS